VTDRAQVVLVQPRIPQNVGAIGRLCAANAVGLHVVRPIPFDMSDRSLRRAGMDYLELLDLHVHLGWEHARDALAPRRFWFLTSAGTTDLYTIRFQPTDVLVFGSEVEGLPPAVRDEINGRDVRIPMAQPAARCLNLATSVAICLYEVLRQTDGFRPAAHP
jgi:tRNA (cytidine/uridine-2'-O-)-methyltransferase